MKLNKRAKALVIGLMLAAAVAFTGCSMFGGAQEQVSYEPIQEDEAIRDCTLAMTDGSEITLSELNGKPVMLVFWGTWCGPCKEEMPALQQIYDEYGDKVQIIAVNEGEDREVVDAFIADNPYTFPVAYDDGGVVSSMYPRNGIPYIVVADGNGVVTKVLEGSRGGDLQYKAFKRALDEVV